MPTLHLIDADSTQACPAVMVAVRARMDQGTGDDRLLLLGGPPLEGMARDAGIDRTHRITPRFGRVGLTTHAVRRWLRTQPDYDQVHAWSLNALLVCGFVLPKTPACFSCVHTMPAESLIRLRKFVKSPWPKPVRVITHSPVQAQALLENRIEAQVEPGLILEHPPAGPTDASAASGRDGWHASCETQKTVLLLCDHPTQANAMDAAAITCLAGATLAGPDGQPAGVRLLMHPGQWNRKRAQAFLADQSDTHSLVQDVRAVEPWTLLSECDAALALGPDAGGLSLHWALNAGLSVITDQPDALGGPDTPPPNLHVARSSAHKDVAHLLHQALMGAGELRTV